MYGIVHSVKQKMHSRERARYGLRGVRVGEANNPGPSAVEANNVMEFDLTQRDSSDVDSHSENEARVHDTLSDTESVRSWPGGRHPRRRRLRFRWHEDTRADVGHRDVRVVSHLVENLARRIGCLPAGAQVPRAIQQHRWSTFQRPSDVGSGKFGRFHTSVGLARAPSEECDRACRVPRRISTRQFRSDGKMEGVAGGVSCVGHLES